MAITKITTPELFDFSATNTALQLPTGDTASRPSAPSAGEWRFNSELKYVEYYDGAAWFQIDTESSAPPIVPNENFNTNTYFGTGATQTIDAKFNEAANFNGASSYIQIANDSFNYTTMTFSAWVNPSANDTYNYIFQNGMYDNRIGGSIGWYVRRESGGSLLARGFSSNSLTVAEFDVTSSGGNIVPLNTWTNVVCVLTPTSFNIYINGSSTAVASATFSNAITYSASQPSAVVIGANYYYFNGVLYESWWEGAIDQVRIFNTALTSAQVEDLYTDETTTTAATLDFPAGAGCIAAYQLDGNGNDVGITTTTTTATYQFDNATTSIPNNTYPGTAYNLNSYVTGQFGNAASFNGSNSYITTNYNVNFSNTAWTISFWMKADIANDRYVLGTDGMSISARSIGSVFLISGGNTAITYSTGVWKHFVYTFDGSGTSNGYGNGILEDTKSSSISSNSNPITFGRYGSNNAGYFDGAIDQVRIFNSELPQAAITALYNETTTTATSPSISYSTYPGTTTDIGYTGLKFQPDFVWIKNRQPGGVGYSHQLYDVIRGVTEAIFTNDTDKQYTRPQGLQSFNTNGITVGSRADTNSGDMVSWNFKAGGAAVQNNDGTINGANCLVSANQASGFSIVKYVGNNTQNATVGHGLGIEPKMVIIKRTDDVNAWWIPLPILGSNRFMEFSSAAATTDVQYQYTQTTDVFKFTSATQSGQYNASGGQYVMYSFADIPDYQKVGKYNGSSSSVEETVGFQPRYVLIKNADAVRRWVIFDNKRNNFGSYLDPADTLAEQTDSSIAITVTSTSFILPAGANYTINSSGYEYIYLAIA